MIDTHCHVDLYEQPQVVAEAAEAAAITTIAVTYLPSHFEIAEQHLKSFKHVIPALGLHPMAVVDHKPELRKFRQCLGRARAIGEIGLDFSSQGKTSRIAQEESFAFVLSLLTECHKFTTLHSRGAEDAVLSHLKRANFGPVVFHWFSGSRSQLIRVLNEGHFISLNTAMINTSKWSELIKLVPRSVMLTESDGPFIKRGKRPVQPCDMELIVGWLAEQWVTSSGEVLRVIQENFRSLFERAPNFLKHPAET